jgi:hypothetical protein
MGIAAKLGNFSKNIVIGGETTDSWTEFYLAMALDFEQAMVVKRFTASAANVAISKNLDEDSTNFIKNSVDNTLFAYLLTNEYDKVIRGGKTIIGGMPIALGNKPLMFVTLLTILKAQSVSKTGDLLRDIGPAILAYWTPAFTTLIDTPTIPCIGTVKNIQTVLGINIFPGIWTPIVIPAMGTVQPWLMSFIASASLHLLTVSGIITCISQYPPPAPPAPGILPYVGYFVKPVSVVKGNKLADTLKKSLKKNLQGLIDIATSPQTLVLLGSEAAAALIENGLANKGDTISDVVAGTITDVAGALVEGGKLDSAAIKQNIKDSLTATTDSLSNIIAQRPPEPTTIKSSGG